MCLEKLKYSALFLCVLFVFYRCEKADSEVFIRGEIVNVSSPYIIATHLRLGELVVDSVFPRKGKFSYKTSIDTFTVFNFYFNNYAASTVFVAEKNDKIHLRGDATFPDLIEVEGGRINNDLANFKKANEALLTERAQLARKIEKEANRHIDNGFAGKNEQKTKINGFNHELTLSVETYIKENPEKIASVLLINNYLINCQNPDALHRSLGYLKGEAKKFPLTKSLEILDEKIQKSTEGALFPSFTLTDNKNKTLKSEDFYGKFLVLSFLSSSDSLSRENARQLKKIYKKVSKKEVNFLSIYLDASDYPIAPAKEDSLKWSIVEMEKGWASEIADVYNIKYLPINILISPKGTIMNREIPAREIPAAIDAEKEKQKLEERELK